MSAPAPSLASELAVRAFAAIADAGELLRRPALLATFADAFGPEADATLVLASGDVGALSAGFAQAAAAVGLTDAELPDVLALDCGPLAEAPAWIAAQVHAVLTEERPADPFAALPRCTVADGVRLRALGALHAELAEVRAALPERATVPESFGDVLRDDAPDVYGAAAELARRTGASHIIDVGCGHAEQLLKLAPEFRLVGVGAGESLAHCRAAFPQHTWLGWDIGREPFPDLPPALLRRAIVVCAGALEPLADPSGLLAGLRRVAADAQAIVLAAPDPELVALMEAGGLAPAFAGRTTHGAVAIVDRHRAGPIAPAPDDFTVTAVLPAFNEADIVEHSVRRLVAQGVRVVVVDNWSTDDTVARVEALGLGDRVRVERFPADGPSETYDWGALLANTERIAAELGDGWVIHQDVDEIRESPWAGVGLRDALHHVQRCGYSAIDHTVIDFVPVDDEFADRSDHEQHLRHFRFGARPGHFLQLKAWDARAGRVDLASSGGHEARFLGRRVFPYKFLLKHYPVRSQAHGERKVFAERAARWNAEERARGWHVHYDALPVEHVFVRPAGELLPYDGGHGFAAEYLVERLTGAGIVAAAERRAAATQTA